MENSDNLSKTLKIVIPGELPSLNEYINTERRNRFLGAKMKKIATNSVSWIITMNIRPIVMIQTPVFMEYHWYCRNKKKDKSNIAFAKKFIEDGLQQSGVIKQDNWNAVIGFSDHFYIDGENPRVEVIIKY